MPADSFRIRPAWRGPPPAPRWDRHIVEGLREWTEAWGALWAMLASLGTLIAVGIAIWSARREGKARDAADARAERVDQERAEEAQRSADERARHADNERLGQARQMIAWLEHRPPDPARPFFDATGERKLRQQHVLCYVNHSDAPVFEVSLHLYWQWKNDDAVVRQIAVVPGGARDEIVLTAEHQMVAADAIGMVMFRDLRGLHWRRWENGYLNEMDENGHEKPIPPVL